MSHKLGAVRCVLITLVLVGASACTASSGDRGPTSSPAAGPVDACTVVSQSEASHALGDDVSAPRRGTKVDNGGIPCVFFASTAPGAQNPDVPSDDSVRVVLIRGAAAPTSFRRYRAQVQPRPIAGLGASAFFEGASLNVLQGSVYLRIAVIGPVPNVLDAEKRLASAALERL